MTEQNIPTLQANDNKLIIFQGNTYFNDYPIIREDNTTFLDTNKEFFLQKIQKFKVNQSPVKEISIPFVFNIKDSHFMPIILKLKRDTTGKTIGELIISNQETFDINNSNFNTLLKSIDIEVSLTIKKDTTSELKWVPFANNNCLLTAYFSLYLSNKKNFDLNEYKTIEYMARDGNSTEFRKYALYEFIKNLLNKKNDSEAGQQLVQKDLEDIKAIYKNWFVDTQDLDSLLGLKGLLENGKTIADVIKQIETMQTEIYKKNQAELAKTQAELAKAQEEVNKDEPKKMQGGEAKAKEKTSEEIECEEWETSYFNHIREEAKLGGKINFNDVNSNENYILTFDNLLTNSYNSKYCISQSESSEANGDLLDITILDKKSTLTKNKFKDGLGDLIKEYMEDCPDYRLKPSKKELAKESADGNTYKTPFKHLQKTNINAIKNISKRYSGGMRFFLESDKRNPKQPITTAEAVVVICQLLGKEQIKGGECYSQILKYLQVDQIEKKLQNQVKIVLAKELELRRLMMFKNKIQCANVTLLDNAKLKPVRREVDNSSSASEVEINEKNKETSISLII